MTVAKSAASPSVSHSIKPGDVRPVLLEGSSGPTVRALQNRLNVLGAKLDVDGIFGPATAAAVKLFQKVVGLVQDAIVGPDTWAALATRNPRLMPAKAPQMADVVSFSSAATSARPSLRASLENAFRGNPFTGKARECFRFAWHMATRSGGRDVWSAKGTKAHQWKSLDHLGTMMGNGTLKTGMVVYANRSPGADPMSTNLAYGPHWFIYMGNGVFADQYGKTDLAGMKATIPGRKLDEVFDPFA
ncbi:MAG: peptidoglycan-binding domain-containing protein [Candidatus Sericytochromatia bacterium]|nr:peptidoglycan-binding domain-containing protein [Candidatus Sericytochromatia bacterium]